jgi:hypothetical protein
LGESYDETRQLKKQIDDLDRRAEIEKTLIYDESVYWMQQPDGTRQGPFCPTCWDADGKLIRLNPGRKTGSFQCTFHQTKFITAGFKDDPPFTIIPAPRRNGIWDL